MRVKTIAAITAVLTITLPLSALSAEKKTKHERKLQPVSQPAAKEKVVSPFLPITDNFTLPSTLPTKFLGHNPQEIISVAISKLPVLKKQQFETTEEYKSRILQPNDLILPLSTNRLYAFTEELHSRYIADEGLIFSSIGMGSKSGVSNADIMLSYNNEVTGSYVATNSHGALLDVTKNIGQSFEMSFNKTEASTFFGSNINERFDNGQYNTNINCYINIPVAAEEAKREIDHLAILYVTTLMPNLLLSETNHFQPEFNDPTERTNTTYKLQVSIDGIYIYSRETGKIFANFNGNPESLKLKCQ